MMNTIHASNNRELIRRSATQFELKLSGVPHGRLYLSLNALDFDTATATSAPKKVGTLRVTVKHK
jgi:hypothetical protein